MMGLHCLSKQRDLHAVLTMRCISVSLYHQVSIMHICNRLVTNISGFFVVFFLFHYYFFILFCVCKLTNCFPAKESEFRSPNIIIVIIELIFILMFLSYKSCLPTAVF